MTLFQFVLRKNCEETVITIPNQSDTYDSPSAARKDLTRHLRREQVSAMNIRERLMGLVQILEQRDTVTYWHAMRVASYALRWARSQQTPARAARTYYMAGLLHDIGKIWLADAILNKQAALSPDEIIAVREHTVYGAHILAGYDAPEIYIQTARSHHERIDGAGYPDGLSGAEIPFTAKLIAVIDMFDVITTERPYKAAQSTEAALRILGEEAGNALDPTIVQSFSQWVQENFILHSPAD